MERIVLEVNKATAKKWRTSNKEQKQKYAAVFQKTLQENGVQSVKEIPLGYARPSDEEAKAHFERVQKDLPEYRNFLDRISAEATKRGLTDEILEELLREDD